ncbi:GNAT family N-acetyltransferase [Alkaliphilus pronyensis]|uniref:GNAT family N-acetyltransferase n=1 Tax=Alkaliphilus pronyensis TaxID=1482732 RepID=A0A6I0FDG7_9FIRM|nr:GNAT family N-acetyltransferase [Alkaliphilus pronyensis]KAB3537296.1 GNAT family N-acetyltransferase [Alkaliphilus pronyensis]
MIETRLARKEDIKELSIFISRMNRNEENHIGFCGTDSKEIENSLVEDITDIPFTESFIIAINDDKIIGALGFDADIESNNVEIWGPFIEKSKWDTVLDLWSKMLELIPNEIEIMSMFINKENKNCIELVNSLQFKRESDQTILFFERSFTHKLENIPIIELSADYHKQMEILHDNTFSNAYYSGSKIIERLNSYRKVFVDIEKASLTGYVYVEVNPRFGEGSIEFFAVDKSKRGKGIGVKLLTMALKWIFLLIQ